ncbi:hypothetical protein M436DRAFT_63835 [Aureobasidium namibiae CBS 147.97]|uniref:Uncharacterized protein n=1 Tax=Aureobasidium namibiae CBS 147.97 TaxID=1043004 RepID=A0A074WPL6_9PEZI|nr:uncharacterized protein M436DRAFT_63835 [Aureobasidium namibiae CBS 147.97]KEQ73554.1 hypothetical protein M436DRAFT_63835 [Aureobasidium namibiae CBS 147.97]
MDAGRKYCPKRPSAVLGQIREDFTAGFLAQKCDQKGSLFSSHQCFCAGLLPLGRSMWLADTEYLHSIHASSAPHVVTCASDKEGHASSYTNYCHRRKTIFCFTATTRSWTGHSQRNCLPTRLHLASEVQTNLKPVKVLFERTWWTAGARIFPCCAVRKRDSLSYVIKDIVVDAPRSITRMIYEIEHWPGSTNPVGQVDKIRDLNRARNRGGAISDRQDTSRPRTRHYYVIVLYWHYQLNDKRATDQRIADRNIEHIVCIVLDCR